MVKQVILSGCGIKFDAKALGKAHIDVPAVIASPPPGEGDSGEGMVQGGGGSDMQDVLAAIHDRLTTQPLWWILELLPMKFTWQEEDGRWKNEWGYALTSTV